MSPIPCSMGRGSFRRWLLASALVISFVPTVLNAAEPERAPKQQNTERGAETAILESIESYVKAYNRGDAQGVAEHWSDTGEWTSPSGERIVGRADIEAGLAKMFSERPGTTIDVRDPSVRLLSSDVAVERGTVLVRAPGEEAERSTYVALHVKRGDAWKLDSVYETASDDAPSTASHLEGLEQLVGQWSDTSPESEVRANIFWLKNKSFLNYSFSVAAPGADELEGTQVVGWDPAGGSIRSWMFDSDGGRGEGVWTRSKTGWVVKLQQTLPDGRRASSTNVYTIVDDDTLLWRSVGRKIDDEYLPNIEDVKLVRKKTNSEFREGTAVSAVPAP